MANINLNPSPSPKPNQRFFRFKRFEDLIKAHGNYYRNKPFLGK